MYTVIETLEFQSAARKIWSDDERFAFIDYIAQNPLAGDVIPQAEGARKVRWTASGKGKRGGARVIYFNMLDSGLIVLLTVYVKAVQVNISTNAVKVAKNECTKS